MTSHGDDHKSGHGRRAGWGEGWRDEFRMWRGGRQDEGRIITIRKQKRRVIRLTGFFFFLPFYRPERSGQKLNYSEFKRINLAGPAEQVIKARTATQDSAGTKTHSSVRFENAKNPIDPQFSHQTAAAPGRDYLALQVN